MGDQEYSATVLIQNYTATSTLITTEFLWLTGRVELV